MRKLISHDLVSHLLDKPDVRRCHQAAIRHLRERESYYRRASWKNSWLQPTVRFPLSVPRLHKPSVALWL